MNLKADIPLRIRSYNTDRLPQFLQLKYKVMSEDPYRFFRATTHLFYEDIAATSFLRDAPNVWLCGDLHLENYGSYKGDNGAAYFNINDFDESNLGPCLFDVVRLLTSINVASASLGLSSNNADKLTHAFVDMYFSKLEEGDINTIENESAKGIMKDFLEDVNERKREDFLIKRTVKSAEQRTLLIDNKRAVAIPENEKAGIIKSIKTWASKSTTSGFFSVKDVAYRLAGTSSLGLKRYIVLIEGYGSPDENYLLEIKETRPSCVEIYNNVPQPKWLTQSQRIIEVQKRLLANPPALLNSIQIEGKFFVMKELQPAADRIDYNLFKGNTKKLQLIIEDMASIYAWDNLRSTSIEGSASANDLMKFASQAQNVKIELVKYARQYSKIVSLYQNFFTEAYSNEYFQ